jgi:hypothetical protein
VLELEARPNLRPSLEQSGEANAQVWQNLYNTARFRVMLGMPARQHSHASHLVRACTKAGSHMGTKLYSLGHRPERACQLTCPLESMAQTVELGSSLDGQSPNGMCTHNAHTAITHWQTCTSLTGLCT